MYFLPSIQSNHRRAGTSFSNPLNGLLYRNQSFLSRCQPESPNHNQLILPRKLNLNHTKTIDHSHRAQTITISPNPNSYAFSTPRQYQTLQNHPSTKPQLKKTSLKASPQLQPKSSTIHFQAKSLFPQVNLIVLDKNKCFSSFKKISLSLKQFFLEYFPTSFRKNLNQQFLGLVSKYIRKMKEQPIQFVSISRGEQQDLDCLSVEECSRKIMEKEEKYAFALAKGLPPQQVNKYLSHIHYIVQKFCLPNVEFQQILMDNLISAIEDVLGKAGGSPQGRMVLALNESQIVGNFIDIPFNANTLYVTHLNEIELSTKSLIIKQRVNDFNFYLKSENIKDYRNSLNQKLIDRLAHQSKLNIDPSINTFRLFSKKSSNSRIRQAQDLLQLKQRSSGRTSRKSNKLILLELASQRNITFPKHQDLLFHLPVSNIPSFVRLKKEFRRLVEKTALFEGLEANLDLNSSTIFIHLLCEQNQALKHFKGKQVEEIMIALKPTEFAWKSSLPERMNWQEFIQFHLISSSVVGSCYEMKECREIIQNFVIKYVFGEQKVLSWSKLNDKFERMGEGDKETSRMGCEVSWSWLMENKLVEGDILEADSLRKYSSRSKSFFLMVIGFVFQTFQVSPIDLAFQIIS